MARPKLFRSLWFVMTASLLAGAVLAEVVLRVLLFNDSAFVGRMSAGVRQPGNFAESNSDDDYWKLRVLFTPPEQREPCFGFDPTLGWTNVFVKPGTYEHLRACPPDDRRLVLLYGDSYAACLTSEPDCFPAILERSDLSQRYCMLNYGVTGYGLDQIYLLIKNSIPLYEDRKPFVIIGILVENALERTVLSFREWPKPRLQLVDGELELAEPVRDGFESYMEAHPLQIHSYLTRYLAHRSRLLPKAWRESLKGDGPKLDEKKAIAGQLLVEIERELSSRGIEHAFVLFHTRGALTPSSSWPWQETFVRETCAELGARLISTRAYLWAASAGVPTEPSRFYLQTGGGVGHLNSIGNAIAFEALRDALEGRPDAPTNPDVIEAIAQRGFPAVRRREVPQSFAGRPARVVTDVEPVPVRASESHVPPFDRFEDAARECIAAGAIDATRVEIELVHAATRLRASARATVYPVSDRPPAGTVLFEIEADGRSVLREELDVGGSARALDIDLAGVRHLTLVCTPVGSTPADAWVCLSDPRFE
jgi:hypothetical protein